MDMNQPLNGTGDGPPVLYTLIVQHVPNVEDRRLTAPIAAKWEVRRQEASRLVFECPRERTIVVLSARQESDGRDWLHATIQMPQAFPTLPELLVLKLQFLGNDRPAYWQIPRADAEGHVTMSNLVTISACIDETDTPPIPEGVGERWI
jgi:hypothetical protein